MATVTYVVVLGLFKVVVSFCRQNLLYWSIGAKLSLAPCLFVSNTTAAYLLPAQLQLPNLQPQIIPMRKS